ncbi:uncharacterized protein LOC122507769 isoform X2 [Leptopilina heterotoma]|uniref:uncharacterized protein LOC122507769 isoform X2 n=1 Tax=Leptopilina heterotoma TaxID=63436 RepID=UPI001CA97B37|nr:uncharacterized protein LOC122507769 isoform X2 [Leptopilina heterotoma]
MKFNNEILYFLLLFIQSNHFCLSEKQNDHDIKRTGNELHNTKEMNVSDCELINFYKKSSILGNILETVNVNELLIIIADDMNDGIILADFLSNGTRIKLATEELSDNEVILNNEILQNIYFYHTSSQMKHIFVYPRNTSNPLLTTLITSQIINSANLLKVALTCNNTNSKETLNSMFLIATNVLDIDIQRRRCEMEYNIIFLLLNINSRECTLGVVIVGYFSSFNI